METTFKQGYALIIGVGNCSYSAWSLPTTVNDVKAIKSILTDPQFCCYPNSEEHVRLLCNTEASCHGILSGLEWLQTETENDPDSTCFIYYSGHGWFDISSGNYYLIPSDVEPFDIQSSAISATTFSNKLKKISSKRIIVLLDCCHAGGMNVNKSVSYFNLPKEFKSIAPPKLMINELKQGSGRVVFSSSKEEQKSWILPDQSMSIFTFHLLEALHGAANRQGETNIKISNLMNHLGKSVPISAKAHYNVEQIPFFETASEDFPVSLLRAGKGLPIGGWEKVQEEYKQRIKNIRNVATGSKNVQIGGNFESGNIYNAPVTYNVIPNSVGDKLAEQDSKPNDNKIGSSAFTHEKKNDVIINRKNQQDAWSIESPSPAVANITDYIPGTIFPKLIRMVYAGGYEVQMEFEEGAYRPKKTTFYKEGKEVNPLVDLDKHILKFPKGTVWITDKLVIPFDNNSKPEPDKWSVKLPALPINQRTHMQYGSNNEVYITQEFSFEKGYRILTAVNPVKKENNKIEVFFFHKNRQIQPIIDHDTKTVSFPEKE